MGLTRGSLYKAFRDKRNLYLSVLDHYEQTAVDAGVARMTVPEGTGGAQGPDGAMRIVEVFQAIADAVAQGDCPGCLICTAAAGPEMADPDIAAVVQQGLEKLRDGFGGALTLSAAHKGLDTATRQEMANALLTQYVGLRVLSRVGETVGIVEASPQHARLILSAKAV